MALAILALAVVSCQKEEVLSPEMDALEFSCDTMAFDTVFTQMGTTTRQFKVYGGSQCGYSCG